MEKIRKLKANCYCGGTFIRKPVEFENYYSKRVSYLLSCNQCGDTQGSPEQALSHKIKTTKKYALNQTT